MTLFPSPEPPRRPGRRRTGYGCVTDPILWTLRGWLGLFFLGAGYAKVSQPEDVLARMMEWPAHVDLAIIRPMGGVELAAALLLALPVVVDRPRARDIALWSTAFLTVEAVAFALYHAFAGQAGLTLINLGLILIGGTLLGERRAYAVRDPGATGGRAPID